MKMARVSVIFAMLFLGTTLSIDVTSVVYEYACPVLKDASCPDPTFIKFQLFTRTNPNKAQTLSLSEDNLSETNYKAAHPTKIIIHGFLAYSDDPLIMSLKTEYLKKGEYNVISVDWSKLYSNVLCYTVAMTNTHHVGACVAGLIERLREQSAHDIHVVGHSLGAHIAGIAGNNLKPHLLTRITGLDPSGVYYGTVDNLDEILDSTDATFVDIIHTNTNAAGKPQPTGHVDFYMNDGESQPGCMYSPVCSHLRSIPYFAESINSDIGFYGRQCSDHASFSSGQCQLQQINTVLMGEGASFGTRGIVFVPTNSAPNFAMGEITHSEDNQSHWHWMHYHIEKIYSVLNSFQLW